MSKFLKFFCKACKSQFYTAYKATRCINCGSANIIPQGHGNPKHDKKKIYIDELTDEDFILDEIEDMEDSDFE